MKDRDEFLPYRIRGITEISEDVRIFELEGSAKVRPGNFVILWIPGVSERPFSLVDNSPIRIMIRRVGGDISFTSSIFRKKAGDTIFMRGPYGNSFLDFYDSGKPACLVAGGIGIAPLAFLAKHANPKKTKVLLGSRTEREAIPCSKLLGSLDVMVSTDDGSFGRKGFVTDLIDECKIKKGTMFFICGPEKMAVATAEKAMKYTEPGNIILSVERYMKCLGYGICGHCEIRGGDGRTYLTCSDGPVFTYHQMRGGDLGLSRRTRSGARVSV